LKTIYSFLNLFDRKNIGAVVIMIVNNKLNIKELLYKEKYSSKLIRKKIFKNIGVKQMMSIELISTLLSGFFNDEYL
tara:strand:+ start:127 stop:357 length:231 start_codon:yes stop_codon:yes gene_type:complete